MARFNIPRKTYAMHFHARVDFVIVTRAFNNRIETIVLKLGVSWSVHIITEKETTVEHDPRYTH
jgi:hypothetical protein